MRFHDLVLRTVRARHLLASRAALILVLGVSLSGISDAGASTDRLPYRLEPSMSSSEGTHQTHLAASGALVVWEDSRTGSPDIYAYDQNTDREFRLAQDAAYRQAPAISGDRVVWVAGSQPGQQSIEGIDLRRGTDFSPTSQPGTYADPRISGELVVWRERANDSWEIVLHNLRTGATERLTDDALNQAYPDIAGTTVVWQEFTGSNWDLVLFDTVSKRRTPLLTMQDESSAALTDDWLVFRRDNQHGGPPQLVLFDLRTHQESIITSTHMVMQPGIAGGVVVWQDWRTGLPDIYADDIEREQIFAVARSQQAYSPAVSEEGIAWVGLSNITQGRVQAVSFIQRLPTDAQEPPVETSAHHVFVDETMHFISGGFKDFWQANGGPQIFGYPLTEEFVETNDVTGEEVIVQYFERVKLEYHPTAAAGETISVARLGNELTVERQFQPIEPFDDTGDRRYFSETGHSIAFGFKQYWEARGGLAIFGFPISEEIVENGRTVQYFEQARLELDPKASDAQDNVTLGLLGREALQRKGWLTTPSKELTPLYE